MTTREEVLDVIQARLAALEEERSGLEALVRLYQDGGAEEVPLPVKQSAPKRSAAAVHLARARANRARASSRRVQLLAYVQDHQGCTVKDVATHMGLRDATGLYRIVKDCQRAHELRKDGQQLFTVEG